MTEDDIKELKSRFECFKIAYKTLVYSIREHADLELSKKIMKRHFEIFDEELENFRPEE